MLYEKWYNPTSFNSQKTLLNEASGAGEAVSELIERIFRGSNFLRGLKQAIPKLVDIADDKLGKIFSDVLQRGMRKAWFKTAEQIDTFLKNVDSTIVGTGTKAKLDQVIKEIWEQMPEALRKGAPDQIKSMKESIRDIIKAKLELASIQLKNVAENKGMIDSAFEVLTKNDELQKQLSNTMAPALLRGADEDAILNTIKDTIKNSDAALKVLPTEEADLIAEEIARKWFRESDRAAAAIKKTKKIIDKRPKKQRTTDAPDPKKQPTEGPEVKGPDVSPKARHERGRNAFDSLSTNNRTNLQDVVDKIKGKTDESIDDLERILEGGQWKAILKEQDIVARDLATYLITKRTTMWKKLARACLKPFGKGAGGIGGGVCKSLEVLGLGTGLIIWLMQETQKEMQKEMEEMQKGMKGIKPGQVGVPGISHPGGEGEGVWGLTPKQIKIMTAHCEKWGDREACDRLDEEGITTTPNVTALEKALQQKPPAPGRQAAPPGRPTSGSVAWPKQSSTGKPWPGERDWVGLTSDDVIKRLAAVGIKYDSGMKWVKRLPRKHPVRIAYRKWWSLRENTELPRAKSRLKASLTKRVKSP